MDAPLFLDFDEACRLLGIARSTGYRLARNGEFPVKVTPIGGRLKVARVQIERLADGADNTTRELAS